jgi:hypothetical protein
VQNIGLNARILSTRTFTIFVVMALVTTFASSPLTMFFYPPWYQKKVEAWRRGEIDWDTGKPLDGAEHAHDTVLYEKLASEKISRLTVYLRLDSMPNLLAFTSLFGGNAEKPAPKIHPSKATSSSSEADESTTDGTAPTRPVEAYGLRLLNLTDRGSSVMQVSEIESYSAYDPVVNTFRTFGRLHNLAVSGEVLVVPESSFAETLSTRASDSNLLVLPWSETGGMSEQAIIEDRGTKNKLAAASYISFVNATFAASTIPVAVLVNKNFGGSKNKDARAGRLTRTYSAVSLHSARDKAVTAPIADKSHHMFAPFFGGPDDRAALRLVLQLAANPHVTATIVHFETAEDVLPTTTTTGGQDAPQTTTTTSTADKQETTVVTSLTARDSDAAFFASLSASLPADLAPRVVFETVPCAAPVADVVARAATEVGQTPRNAGDLIVLGRNIARNGVLGGASAQGADEIRASVEAASSLGVLAERVWAAKVGASVLVVQAGQ